MNAMEILGVALLFVCASETVAAPEDLGAADLKIFLMYVLSNPDGGTAYGVSYKKAYLTNNNWSNPGVKEADINKLPSNIIANYEGYQEVYKDTSGDFQLFCDDLKRFPMYKLLYKVKEVKGPVIMRLNLIVENKKMNKQIMKQEEVE